MDLEARPYRAFVKVAETGSFTRAAELLHVSQPALSAQIRELERRLGFALFDRHSRRVSLTADGHIFIDRAKRLIIETEWLNQSAREIRDNRLRIGTAHHSGTFALRRTLIEEFIRANPGIPLAVSSRTHAQLFEDLRTGVIDVAITLELVDGDHSAVEPKEVGFDRYAVEQRAIGFALPEDHTLARCATDATMVSGAQIATISRVHGIALAEAVARRITDLGAALVYPPEGDAQSLVRYAEVMGLIAIDLGWLDGLPGRMAPVACPGLGLATQLELITFGTQRTAAQDFLSFAHSQ